MVLVEMKKDYKQLIFELKMKEQRLNEYEATLVDRGTKVAELIRKLNRKETALNKKEALLGRDKKLLDEKKWEAYVSSELEMEEVPETPLPTTVEPKIQPRVSESASV